MRRLGPPLYGARYCGNRVNKEVHDLNNEATQCEIDKIWVAGCAVPFKNLEEARKAGYGNLHDCTQNSKK